jgi:tetratricopeptide (TPR) repeat protein
MSNAAGEAFALAVEAYGRGDLGAARGALDKAARLLPDTPAILHLRGLVEMAGGAPMVAIVWLQQAVALAPPPGTPLHLNNLGVALRQVGRAAEAVPALQRAIAIDPGYASAHNNLGAALAELGRHGEARDAFARACALRPDDAEAAINLGNSHVQLGALDAALEVYRATAARHPDTAAPLNAIALTLVQLDRDMEALPFLDRVIAIDAGFKDALFNRAMLLLRQGRSGAAWSDYRWRTRSPTQPPKSRWPATPAARQLHLLGEQGIGDQLFFLRFAPSALARGVALTVDCDPRIAGFVARAGLAVARVPPPGAEIAALGDLPWLLGCGDCDMPPPLRFAPLPAPEARIAALLHGLPRPLTGAAWRAGADMNGTDSTRFVPPAALGAALRGRPGTILSVQRAARPDEQAAFEAGLGRPVVDLGALNDDLEAMLALVASLDVLTGVGSTNVHLRHGAGRGSDILVPAAMDWRWRVDEAGAVPWYPGSRAYRQRPGADWSAPLAALAADLGADAPAPSNSGVTMHRPPA